MATQYTSILKLALPVTGELSGTWGDVVNNNITSMIEQAIAGLSTINTWTANAHTLTVADGTTSESRCAMLVAATGAGGTALTAAGEIICPAASKLYVLKNGAAYAVTLKTAAGTGVAVPAGDTAFLFCDGTNVNACVTTIVNGHISGNLTVDGNTTLGDANTDTVTVTAQFASDLLPSTDNARDLGSTAKSWRTLYCDTSVLTPLVTATNLQVTNIKANDSTAAITIADSTGAVGISTAVTMSATTQNINIGTSQTSGLTTIGGTAQTGPIAFGQSTKSQPVGIGVGATESGELKTIRIGTFGVAGSTTDITIGSTNGTTITLNGTVNATTVNATTVDTTNLEVTNIKAKDGTAALSIADSTGAFTVATALTANGGAVFNENGADVDFRVEGDTDANLIFADASTDRVGIGTNAPLSLLHVAGDIRSTGDIVLVGGAGTPEVQFFQNAGNWKIAVDNDAMQFVDSSAATERMRITSAGNVLIGTTASLGTAGVQAAAVSTDPFEGYRFGANANGPTVSLYKNRGATVGTNAVVVSGDELGTIAFRGYDGAAYRAGAFITGSVDGTPGASDMPGRLTFSTTADGAATPTERMRITSAGNVGIGTDAPVAQLQVNRVGDGTYASTLAESRSKAGLILNPESTGSSVALNISKAVGGGGIIYQPTNSAATTAYDNIFNPFGGNVGIGTVTPTNKLTVDGNANVTGNTTLGDASTDTVTVNGYMAVGGALNSGIAVRIGSSALGGATQRGAYADVTFTSASTTRGAAFESNPSTAVASFTVTDVMGFSAQNVATLGAGSTITNQHGVYVNDQTRGTNNFGVTSLVSSGTNKWNIYASGTANNAFAGNVRIGSTTAPTNALDVTGAMTVSGNVTLGDASTDTVTVNGTMGVGGTNLFPAQYGAHIKNSALTGTNIYGAVSEVTGPATATVSINAFTSIPTTSADTFTVGIVRGFQAINAIKGAGSTITNLHGVWVADQTQGTNNYGITSLVSSGTNKWNIYASGTAQNYFAGNVGIGTVTPAYKLDVFSGTNNSAIARFTGAQSAKGLIVSTYSSNGNDGGVNLASTDSMSFSTASVERLRIDSSGNVSIGGTANRATTVGTAALNIFNGTAPVGTLTNGISIYSAAGEAYVMDAAGNATLFSPHDAETNEWIFKSKHTPTGKVLKIDVEKLLRFVNNHFGLDAIQEFIEE